MQRLQAAFNAALRKLLRRPTWLSASESEMFLLPQRMKLF